MYQITALFQDCEIAYAESEDFQETLVLISEEIADSTYAELPADDIDLSIVNSDSLFTISCKATLYW